MYLLICLYIYEVSFLEGLGPALKFNYTFYGIPWWHSCFLCARSALSSGNGVRYKESMFAVFSISQPSDSASLLSYACTFISSLECILYDFWKLIHGQYVHLSIYKIRRSVFQVSFPLYSPFELCSFCYEVRYLIFSC